MSERANIPQSGASQAVEDGQDEESVRRGDEWTPEFLACLAAWNDDIPRPTSPTIAEGL